MCQKFNNIKHKKMKIILELDPILNLLKLENRNLEIALTFFLKTGRKKLSGKCIFAEIFFSKLLLKVY
jgi:hypothetical protein